MTTSLSGWCPSLADFRFRSLSLTSCRGFSLIVFTVCYNENFLSLSCLNNSLAESTSMILSLHDCRPSLVGTWVSTAVTIFDFQPSLAGTWALDAVTTFDFQLFLAETLDAVIFIIFDFQPSLAGTWVLNAVTPVWLPTVSSRDMSVGRSHHLWLPLFLSETLDYVVIF